MELSAKRVQWTRDQLLIAFKLYCELPFGQMHSLNPEIVRVAQTIGRTPSSLAMKLTNIASLDPAIYLTGRKGLTGASQADRAMWIEMTADWERFWDEANGAFQQLHASFPDAQAVNEIAEEAMDYEGETRETRTRVRVGQSVFRESVLSAYDYRCCVSGTPLRTLLVASHIVPWRLDVKNRLNPRNGLCLSAIHDRAFDAGLMTLAEDFTVMLSNRLSARSNSFMSAAFLQYEGCLIALPAKFPPDPSFLTFHRKEIFVS